MVKFFRLDDGGVIRREGGVDGDDIVPEIPAPERSTEISEAEYTAIIEGYDRADAEAARAAAEKAEAAAKAAAGARKTAFRELTGLGLSAATATLILGIK